MRYDKFKENLIRYNEIFVYALEQSMREAIQPDESEDGGISREKAFQDFKAYAILPDLDPKIVKLCRDAFGAGYRFGVDRKKGVW